MNTAITPVFPSYLGEGTGVAQTLSGVSIAMSVTVDLKRNDYFTTWPI
ncbi:hypothetical protein [Kamptonema formosum]|nr:hypothetical protein [Oscillatoria sp. PCC 10802]